MADIFNEPFDGNGTSPSAGDALSPSNTTIATTFSGGGTSTFSSTAKTGSFSAYFDSGSTGTVANTRVAAWSDSTTATTRYWSFYFRPVNTPSGNCVVLYIGAASGTRTLQLVYNTDGTFKIQNSSAVIIGTSTTDSAPIGEWSRIDLSLVSGTATLEFYPGNASCDDAVGTATAGNTKSGSVSPPANPLRYHEFGISTSRAVAFRVDEFRADSTALPGPAGTSATATPSVVAAVAAAPAPTVVTGTATTATPAVVSGVAATPTPFIVRNQRVTATAVAAVAAVGAASPVTGSSITYEETWDGADGTSITTQPEVFDYNGGGAGTLTRSTGVVKKGTASGHFETSANAFSGDFTTANQTTGYWSLYVRPVLAPSTNTVLFYVGASSATRTFQLVFNTDRTLKIQNTSGVIIGSSTSGQLPLNEWSRIDLSCVSGTVTLALYPGDAQCDQATGTATSGNVRSGAAGATAITYRQLGVLNSSTNDLYIDAWRESATVLPGPVTLDRTVGPASVAASAAVATPTVTAGSGGGTGDLQVVQAWRPTSSGGSTFTTFNATFNATPTAGNLLLCAVNCENTVATPAGWTSLVSDVTGSGMYLFGKIADGTETTTLPLTSPVASAFAAGTAEYSGQAAGTISSLLDGFDTLSGGATISENIGTAQAVDLLIAVGGFYGTATSTITTTGPGWVEQMDRTTSRTTGTDVNINVATQVTSTSGIFDATVTGAGTVSGGHILLVALKIDLANTQVTPTPVAGTVGVGSPVLSTAGDTPTPAVVPATIGIPAPTVDTPGFTAVPPATVAAVVAVFEVARVTTHSTVVPTAVAGVVEVPAPDQLGDGVSVTQVTPTPVDATTAVPAPTIPTSTATTVAITAAVAIVVAVPAPTVEQGVSTTVTPASVPAVAALPTVSAVSSDVLVPITTVGGVATVGTIAIVITEPTYIFRGPVVPERPTNSHGRPHFWTVNVGITVLKIDGAYRQVRFPTDDEIAAATAVYRGGFDTRITQTEADELEAAGLGDYVVVVP